MEYIEPAALRAFFAVAREGNFVRAARALRVQQPAISKAVAALEERLGVTLFERRKAGAVLTREGQRAFERCLRIFDELTLLESDAKRSLDELDGDLWIAASEHVATYLLARALAAFQAEHPRVVPRIVTGAAHLMVGDLESGRFEFGLFMKIEKTARLDRRTIARAPCQVLVARSKRSDPRVLASFIGSRELDDLGNRFFPTLRMLRKTRPETRITLSCSGLEAHKSLVREGCGVSILPLFTVENELRDGTLQRIAVDYSYDAELQLLTRRGHEFSRAARAFLRILNAELRKIRHVEVTPRIERLVVPQETASRIPRE